MNLVYQGSQRQRHRSAWELSESCISRQPKTKAPFSMGAQRILYIKAAKDKDTLQYGSSLNLVYQGSQRQRHRSALELSESCISRQPKTKAPFSMGAQCILYIKAAKDKGTVQHGRSVNLVYQGSQRQRHCSAWELSESCTIKAAKDKGTVQHGSSVNLVYQGSQRQRHRSAWELSASCISRQPKTKAPFSMGDQ